MATFLVNDTSGAVTARITPSGAGRDLVVIDDCGSNCSFMYRAPRRKVTDHSVEVARNYCAKYSDIQESRRNSCRGLCRFFAFFQSDWRMKAVEGMR